MKKFIITLGLLLMAALPSYAQKVDSKAIADGCLTPEEWSVSMAAQGLSPIGLIELSDGFIQYYQIDDDLFILFPFDINQCGMPNIPPAVFTSEKLRLTFGIIVVRD